MPDSKNIFEQLKKRKVFRSIAIYAAFAFVLIQVCSIVFPALHLPDWTETFIVVLVIIGFPINKMIKKDEEKFRREITIDISNYLPN